MSDNSVRSRVCHNILGPTQYFVWIHAAVLKIREPDLDRKLEIVNQPYADKTRIGDNKVGDQFCLSDANSYGESFRNSSTAFDKIETV
jgi:hypothetical protein